jgi:hypothetical protein
MGNRGGRFRDRRSEAAQGGRGRREFCRSTIVTGPLGDDRAAMAAVEIVAQLSSPRRPLGPSYRIVVKCHLDRLAEMVGEPPRQAPSGTHLVELAERPL